MASSLPSDTWEAWEKHGKTNFLNYVGGCVNHSLREQQSFLIQGKVKGLSKIFYELVWNAVRGVIKKNSFLAAVSEIIALHADIPSIILDVINIIDHETTDEPNSENRLKFCGLVHDMEQWLSDSLIKERLEVDTLQDCGILKAKKVFYTRFIKVKTKLFYKQQKFNLFREESEGYAKLIVELNMKGSTDPVHLLEVIQSLIGCFNLDPNRVLDVILESFECHPELHNSVFIPLIKSYMSDSSTLCEVLGFKFTQYSNADQNSTPFSLYIVTALLLQHGIILLEDIYRWLTPSDAQMEENHAKELSDAKDYAHRLNVISTVSKPDEKPEEPMEVAVPENQKFSLCEALLTVGAWDQANLILKRHPYCFLTAQPSVGKALCRLIDYVVDPIYRKLFQLSPKIPGKPAVKPAAWIFPRQAGTLEELRETAIPMLVALGPFLHQSPVLLQKVLRLCHSGLEQMPGPGPKEPPTVEDSFYYDILTMLDIVILPSLIFMESSCCVAEQIWLVVKQLSYQQRYRLYALWKNETFQQHPLLIKRKADCVKKIKFVMKRVSKENVKPTGRLLGKLSHSCPGFLFDYILSQIQIYDNLIGPVVDSLKYLTNLSYDMLGYCILEALSLPDKERTKHDGTSISMWLTSLSAFCGAVYKKYNMELSGLMQFVANQLKAKKSLDLLILQEIVHKMAGIEASVDMTNEQVEAMQGGELLRSEAAQFSQVRNTKKSSQRLKETLVENHLAVALCLLIAQQRNCVVYEEIESSHLKLVGKLYDQCQDTLVQLGSFLASNLSVDDYTKRLPPLESLLSDYHIHADVAFFLARPMFSNAINSKYDELRRAEKNAKNLLPAQKTQKYLEAVQFVMEPLHAAVRPLCPQRVWDDLSPQFFTTFWSLALYDLSVPSAAYEREVQRVRQAMLQLNENRDSPANKRKKELDRCNVLIEKLQEEEKKQREHNERVMARLEQEKEGWFLCRSAKYAKTETITQFLQLCLFPRCVFTSLDALFCARFVRVMHNLKTPNFSTLICYDRIFCDITYTVTSCTENEAHRYGNFLCAMLDTVMRWHSAKKIFDDECASYPGFVTKFRVRNQPSETNDHVDYENYRHVVHKWHHKIAKALVVCLESKDYVQIRNAVIVLIRILPLFPAINSLYNVIERTVETVRQEQREKRPDLFALATSYNGQLKNKKSTMMKEEDFHLVSKKPAPKAPAATSSSSSTAATNGTEKPSDKTDSSSAVNGSASQEEKPAKQETVIPLQKEMKKEPKEEREKTKDKEKEKEKKKDKDGSEKRSKEKKEDRDADRPVVAKTEDLADQETNGYGPEAPETEKDVKRRKTEASSSKSRQNSAERERERREKAERKERRAAEDEERRERKAERKRERLAEEGSTEQKRRKEDERGRSPRPQNDSPLELASDKKGHDKDTPHERSERAERTRRSADVKRR